MYLNYPDIKQKTMVGFFWNWPTVPPTEEQLPQVAPLCKLAGVATRLVVTERAGHAQQMLQVGIVNGVVMAVIVVMVVVMMVVMVVMVVIVVIVVMVVMVRGY